MSKESTGKTLLVATVLSVVCSIALAAAVTLLKPIQDTNKTLEKQRGKIRLMPANPDFEPIELKDEQELQVWGVVTRVIHSL